MDSKFNCFDTNEVSDISLNNNANEKHLQVQRFVTPDEFLEYKEIGEKLGFKHFESSALVRSSYRARKHIQ